MQCAGSRAQVRVSGKIVQIIMFLYITLSCPYPKSDGSTVTGPQVWVVAAGVISLNTKLPVLAWAGRGQLHQAEDVLWSGGWSYYGYYTATKV